MQLDNLYTGFGKFPQMRGFYRVSKEWQVKSRLLLSLCRNFVVLFRNFLGDFLAGGCD